MIRTGIEMRIEIWMWRETAKKIKSAVVKAETHTHTHTPWKIHIKSIKKPKHTVVIQSSDVENRKALHAGTKT